MPNSGYLLGLLGLVQAIFLPGLCVTSIMRQWGWPQRLLFAAPFSLLLNYYLVWALTALGAYSQVSLFSVIALEIACIAFLAQKQPVRQAAYPPLQRPVELMFLVLSVAALTKYSQAWIRDFGDVFQLWDAVVSWNSWGREWSLGNIPDSGLYPNALPIAFSLPYALMGGSELEMFSKASMGLVFLLGIGALIDLGFRRQDLRLLCWACAWIYPSIQARFLQSHWNSGYADVPLALMLVFAFCFGGRKESDAPFLSGLLAGTAALVKQPGLLFAAASPILQGKVNISRPLVLTAAGAAVAAGPWYLFKFANIASGKSDHNTSFLANLVHGGLQERWQTALSLVIHFGGKGYLIACLLLSAIGAFADKEARKWYLLIGLPYLVIWATFFAYDIRNISMALFPIALAVSAGTVYLAMKIEGRLPALMLPDRPPLRSPAFLGKFTLALTILLCALALHRPLGHWRKSGSALAWEKEQRLLLGDSPEANRRFAGLIACQSGSDTLFLTNYWWPKAIPEMQKTTVQAECPAILDAIERKKRAYVYLHGPTCDLGKKMPKPIYSDGSFHIFATSPALPGICGEAARP